MTTIKKIKGKSGNRKIKYAAYLSSNRRLKNRASELTRRFRRYTTLRVLRGIKNTNKELYDAIKKNLKSVENIHPDLEKV